MRVSFILSGLNFQFTRSVERLLTKCFRLLSELCLSNKKVSCTLWESTKNNLRHLTFLALLIYKEVNYFSDICFQSFERTLKASIEVYWYILDFIISLQHLLNFNFGKWSLTNNNKIQMIVIKIYFICMIYILTLLTDIYVLCCGSQ